MLARTLTLEEPFDMLRTLRMLEVGERVDDGSWWWATHTAGGIGTIRIDRTATGVLATAWGEGGEALLERLPDLVGQRDVSVLTRVPDRSRALLRQARGVRLGRSGDVHSALVKAVLGQVVTTREASQNLRRITRSLGDVAPGPRRMVTVPRPEVLSELTYSDLHQFGIERRRAAILIEISRRSNRMLEILPMEREDAYRRLVAVRGIGEWSAAGVMGTAWGDKDAVPVGDYHIPNDVAWVLAGRDRGTDDDMLELLEPFRPERRRFIVALKLGNVHAPRYGPKSAVRRHL